MSRWDEVELEDRSLALFQAEQIVHDLEERIKEMEELISDLQIDNKGLGDEMDEYRNDFRKMTEELKQAKERVKKLEERLKDIPCKRYIVADRVCESVAELQIENEALEKRVKELEMFDNSYHRLIVLCSGLLSGNNDVEDIRAELKSYIIEEVKEQSND